MVIFALASVLLIGCSLKAQEKTTQLRFQWNIPLELSTMKRKGTSAKMIGPASGWKIASYALTFSAQNGEIVTKSLVRGDEEVRLKVGEWDLSAKGLAADGSIILEKQVHFSAEAGKVITLPISLHLAQGKGSLEITLLSSQTPNQNWKYSLLLSYIGLPGDDSIVGPVPRSFFVGTTESSATLTDIDSGLYALTCQLQDATGNVISGTTATILILPQQKTTGSCTVSLSDPTIAISIMSPALELAVDASLGVDRILARGKPIVVPLALPVREASLTDDWYANAEKLDASNRQISQSLLGYRISAVPYQASNLLSIVRIDTVLVDPETHNAQSLSNAQYFADGPADTIVEWVQSLDFRAAMNRSLFNTEDPANNGSGVASPVKWISTSPSGFVSVVGLDKPSAVHLFYAPPEFSSCSAWIRLWREKIVVDKSERSPDRACISYDNSHLAIGASTSNWLRIYSLDQSGAVSKRTDFVSAKNGFQSFENIKALRFSKDSKHLFVLANIPEKIMVLNMEKLEQGQPCLESEFAFSTCFNPPPSSSLGMEDVEILEDGWIAACSSNVARIFLLQYSEGEAKFSSATTFASGVNGESLGNPKSIIFDSAYKIAYCLGYSKKLHTFTMNDGRDGFSFLGTVELMSELDKARALALVQGSSGIRYLSVVGGSCLGMVALDTQGLPVSQTILAPCGEYSAIGSENNVCTIGNSYITSGGENNSAALFEVR